MEIKAGLYLWGEFDPDRYTLGADKGNGDYSTSCLTDIRLVRQHDFRAPFTPEPFRLGRGASRVRCNAEHDRSYVYL